MVIIMYDTAFWATQLLPIASNIDEENHLKSIIQSFNVGLQKKINKETIHYSIIKDYEQTQ